MRKLVVFSARNKQYTFKLLQKKYRIALTWEQDLLAFRVGGQENQQAWEDLFI